MIEKIEIKRQGGQLAIDGSWLVLTESVGKEGVGYKHSCDTMILGAKVAHPIWDGPFPLSGSGQCSYEVVPYCPECELEPGFHGEPISPKGSYHNP